MDNKSYRSDLIDDFFLAEGKLLQVPKGEVIIDPYVANANLYYIGEGFVRSYTVTGEGKCNLLMINGFGELFPFDVDDFPLDKNIYYETKTQARIYKVSKDHFNEAVQRNGKLAQAVWEQLLVFIEAYRDTIHSLQYRTAKEQVVSKLVFLGWRFGNDKKIIEAPITHQDIADYLGLSRETASRVIEGLHNAGMIDRQERKIILKDYEGLQKLI